MFMRGIIQKLDPRSHCFNGTDRQEVVKHVSVQERSNEVDEVEEEEEEEEDKEEEDEVSFPRSEKRRKIRRYNELYQFLIRMAVDGCNQRCVTCTMEKLCSMCLHSLKMNAFAINLLIGCNCKAALSSYSPSLKNEMQQYITQLEMVINASCEHCFKEDAEDDICEYCMSKMKRYSLYMYYALNMCDDTLFLKCIS